jgi:HK97 family phage major capsid protein
MAPTIQELLATARQQIQGSGKDDGPMAKLEAAFTSAMQSVEVSLKSQLTEFEKRINDKIADEVVEGQKKLLHEATRSAGFAHSNPELAVIAAGLIDPAGLTLEQKLTMPDRQLQKYVSVDTFGRIKTFQELNDDCHILGYVLAAIKAGVGGSVSAADIRAALQGTRSYKALQAVAKSLSTGGSATGTEWMPTQFSTQLLDVITVSLKVAANFARINIPANTFKVPIATTDDICFLVAETNSDNLLNESNVYPKFTPGTGNVSFNAKKFAAITVFSEEANEDSIIPLLPFLRMKIANAVANGQERATLDGDTTGTHMDNDVSAATDVRKAWKGLRYHYKTTMSNTADLGTLNLTNVRSLRGKLDAQFAENPENLRWITSVKQMLNLMAFPEFLTMDKYGPNATIVTGEIGKIDGIPVQTSKYCRDNVAATGVNTSGGPNTKGLLYLACPLAFWYGDRREVRIDTGRMIISGQGFLVISQRLDFVDVYPAASNKSGALGINLA